MVSDMPKVPLEFQQAQEIGRTHDVLGCLPVTHIVCRCDRRVPLMLAGCPSRIACPACGRQFILTAVSCEGAMVGTKIEAHEKSRVLETVQ